MKENTSAKRRSSLKTLFIAILLLIAGCFILTLMGPFVATIFNEDLEDNGQCQEIVANHLREPRLAEPIANFPLPAKSETINLANSAETTLLAEQSLPNSLLSWQMIVNDDSVAFVEDPEWCAPLSQLKPDGSQLAQIDSYPSEATIIRICDLANGTQNKAFSSDETTNALAFTPDGQYFLLNEGRGRISMYETEKYTRHSRWDVRGKGEKWRNTNQITISPDGHLAAFAVREPESLAMTIRLWNIEDEVEVASLTGHTNTIVSLAFSQDGSFLLSHGMDDVVRIWGIP